VVKEGAKKWAAIVCVALGAWLIAFAVFNRRQTPHEDSPYEHPALSKATRAILNNSEKFILLSIDPTPPPMQRDLDSALKKDKDDLATTAETGKTNVNRFHDYPILGQTEIKDPKRKSELLSALYGSASRNRNGLPGCFEPRHGIIANRGTNWVELVICFECEQVAEYTDAGNSWSLMTKKESKKTRDLFNQTLQEAAVPLAKR